MTLLKASYKNRKRLEGVVLIAGVLMTLTLFSQLTAVNHEEANTSMTNPYARNVVLVPNTKKEGVKTRVKRWIKKRHTRRMNRIQKKWKEYDIGEKIILSLLTLLIAYLLVVLCISFGCSLSCSGVVFWGELLIFGGSILVIILTIASLFRIWRKPRKSSKKAN